jgi:hypothetical protein
MLLRATLVIALLLALAGCKREPYSQSNSGFSSLDKTLLYDFRNQPRPPSQIDDPTARQVLSAMFPVYASGGRRCRPGEKAPKILDEAQGSFTAAGVKQTVYLIDAGECGNKTDSSTRRLAVFTGGKIAANVETPIGTAILGAYDLNRDGKNELLLERDGGGRGSAERIRIAKLVEFDKDRLAPVEEFGEVYADACSSSLSTKSLTARTVYYLPPPAGQKARFSVEVYRSPCPAKGRKPEWRRDTGS